MSLEITTLEAPGSDALPAETAARLEALAFEHGATYDSYLATEPDREHFWSSDRSGVLAFVRRKRYVHVVGGLLAPPEARGKLLAEFSRLVEQNRWRAVFYNIVDEDLDTFRAAGYQMTKCGEEPLIDLVQTTWKGKSYEWVRRQENYCLRQGVNCAEVPSAPDDPHYRDVLAPELAEISALHIGATQHRRELGVFVTQFNPLRLGRRRLFAARSEKRIEAFIVCNPAEGGRFWAIETYRRRPDAPRGVVPFAMMQTARALQAEGVPRLSLSLIPCLRCEQPQPGDSWVLRRGQSFWWNRMNWVFDMRGIYHYKSRFRPEFRDMYIAARPKLSMGTMYDFLSLWGIIAIGPSAAVQHYWSKFNKLGRRATLANPDNKADGDSSP